MSTDQTEWDDENVPVDLDDLDLDLDDDVDTESDDWEDDKEDEED